MCIIVCLGFLFLLPIMKREILHMYHFSHIHAPNSIEATRIDRLVFSKFWSIKMDVVALFFLLSAGPSFVVSATRKEKKESI